MSKNRPSGGHFEFMQIRHCFTTQNQLKNDINIIIVFIDPKNIGIDTNNDFLRVSYPKIWAKIGQVAAILNLCKLGIVPPLKF